MVELSSLPGSPWVAWMRPTAHRLQAAQFARRRFQWWLEHGGTGLSQWVCADPSDVLVTHGRFSARACTAASP